MQAVLGASYAEAVERRQRFFLQSMVRHSLLSLQEAPMGLRDTPLQKGVILLCRGLRGCLGGRDTPWLWLSSSEQSRRAAITFHQCIFPAGAVPWSSRGQRRHKELQSGLPRLSATFL